MDAYSQAVLYFITLLLRFALTLMPEYPISISIPAMGIQSAVIEFPLNGESWDIHRWEMRVGHLQGTAWFDQPGNIVLGGHSQMPDLSAGIFAELDKLQTGDRITIHLGIEQREYIVASVSSSWANDLTPLYPTRGERLTLITCDTLTYNRTTRTYAKRVVVIAERAR